MIEPVDEDEREQLLRELVVERFGRPPRRDSDETPQVIAQRRRVLCGIDKNRRSA